MEAFLLWLFRQLRPAARPSWRRKNGHRWVRAEPPPIF